MGQKVNPISNRLGIIRGWDSNWYGGKNYGDALLEDSKIRKYLNARLAKSQRFKNCYRTYAEIGDNYLFVQLVRVLSLVKVVRKLTS